METTLIEGTHTHTHTHCLHLHTVIGMEGCTETLHKETRAPSHSQSDLNRQELNTSQVTCDELCSKWTEKKGFYRHPETCSPCRGQQGATLQSFFRNNSPLIYNVGKRFHDNFMLSIYSLRSLLIFNLEIMAPVLKGSENVKQIDPRDGFRSG